MICTYRSTRLLAPVSPDEPMIIGTPSSPRREQHVLEIVRLPRERAGRGVGAQRHGADVVAAGIGRDVVRPRGDADPEALDAQSARIRGVRSGR